MRSRLRTSPPCASRIAADDLERQRVAPHVGGELQALLSRPLDAERREQFRAGLRAQRREVALRRGCGVALQIVDREARRHQTEAGVALREALQQREHALILQLAGERRSRRILQRLQPIEDQQRALGPDDLREPLALLVAALAFDRLGAEEFDRLGEKQVRRGAGLLARALVVERPGERGLAPGPAPRREIVRPFRDERSLPLPAERDESQHERMRLPVASLRPGLLDDRGLRLAADQFGRGVFVDPADVDGRRGRLRLGFPCRTPRRQRYDLADLRPYDRRLARQFAIEVLVARIGQRERLHPITIVRTQRERHSLVGGLAQQYRNETLVALLFVDVLMDDRAFPEGAAPHVEFDSILDAVSIHLRTNNEDEAGVFGPQPLHAPMRPALLRTRLELVEFDLKSHVAQNMRQLQHPRRMLGRVVAVADENLHRRQGRTPAMPCAEGSSSRSGSKENSKRGPAGIASPQITVTRPHLPFSVLHTYQTATGDAIARLPHSLSNNLNSC